MDRGNRTQGEQNLELFQSLIPPEEKLYVWCYDEDGRFIAANCPEETRDLLLQAFTIFGGTDHLKSYAKDTGRTKPLIVGSPVGMQWALSYETERKRRLLFVIGPVFYTQPVESDLRSVLSHFRTGWDSSAWVREFYRLLPGLPVMSYAVFTRYVILIHNTLTGQQLGLDALESVIESGENRPAPGTARDRSKIYLAERAMLRMVREGDINYQNVLQNSILLSPGVPVRGRDPLRQFKTSITVFITLVSRAAMEGGLSPEIAYSLGDSYIQSVENSMDSGELNALAHTMYHDFIYRVHHLHMSPDYSHAVQKCCDYIALSLGRKIRISDLASLVGYTEYYLTEKFKKETGMSVNSYIRLARVNRAKLLLESSDLSVGEIAAELAFNTVNYFIQCFKEVTGVTPAQYRKKLRLTGSAPEAQENQ